jgi:hypothetical protein
MGRDYHAARSRPGGHGPRFRVDERGSGAMELVGWRGGHVGLLFDEPGAEIYYKLACWLGALDAPLKLKRHSM